MKVLDKTMDLNLSEALCIAEGINGYDPDFLCRNNFYSVFYHLLNFGIETCIHEAGNNIWQKVCAQ